MNIFNLSFGKDSMATLLIAIEQGISIDRVMYVDIKFSEHISGEHPIMATWIPKAEEILKEKFGITVDHAYSGVTYLERFYTIVMKGKHIGLNYGFPYILGSWCNSDLKRSAIQKYMHQFSRNETCTNFVGIAYDEPRRWDRMLKKETVYRKYRSLLFEQKIKEVDAFEICERYGLLSPIYLNMNAYRGGCWFCNKQCMADLYSLWKDYPQYFRMLLDIEKVSNRKFLPSTTLREISEKFEKGYVPVRRKSR